MASASSVSWCPAIPGATWCISSTTNTSLPVEHAYFDGGQFAQISPGGRQAMAPLLYLAIKSLYWSHGRTLKRILWCDGQAIRPYFIAAGKALTYRSLRRQLADSLEDKPFPPLSPQLQERVWSAFGSKEEHLKYRSAYPSAHYPVFEGFDHMEHQIKDPSGFAALLTRVMEENTLPDLPFLSLRQESEARR